MNSSSSFKSSANTPVGLRRGNTPIGKASPSKGNIEQFCKIELRSIASENLLPTKHQPQLRSSSRNSFRTQQVTTIGHVQKIGIFSKLINTQIILTGDTNKE